MLGAYLRLGFHKVSCWCYLWNENSVQFRIVYSIDNLFIQVRSFYIKSWSWGRELNTGEKERERERGRECKCRETTRRVLVGNPVVWGKHVFTKKGKNAPGDRLRLMRNMRKIFNDVSHKWPSDVSNSQRHYKQRTIHVFWQRGYI